MAYIEHLPSKDRREFTCIHSATAITIDEASEFKTNQQKQTEILNSLKMIGEKEYKEYGITCETRIQGINSYIEGIATLFNENPNIEEVFDQLVTADQMIGSTDYSLNSEIARFVAKHSHSLEQNYINFLYKKHRIGTSNAFCNGLVADLEKFYDVSNYEDENYESEEEIELAEKIDIILQKANCMKCPYEINSYKELRELDARCYDNIHKVSFSRVRRPFPYQILKFSNLHDFTLVHTDIDVLPKEIGQLTQLNKITISDTDIDRLPKEIGSLANLKTLVLDSNNLMAIPSEIGNLKQLERLILRDNELNTLPPEIGELSELKELHLDNNTLVELPKEVAQLPKLKYLMLHENLITKLPPSLCVKLRENQIKMDIDFESLCKEKK